MTAVHPPASAQVLTNTDLLHCIFVFVPLPPDSRLRDSYLAQCAVVRRAFHEPAIRVLWRNLDSLLPLWHLLAPPNTPFPSSRDRIEGGRGVLSYLQKINSAQLYVDSTQWDRFLLHAAHVRGIVHSYDLSTRQTTSINEETRFLIQSVIMRNGGSTVLPSLRTIECRGPFPCGDALIPFFTSTLRHATFDLRGYNEAAHIPFLRGLRESSPFLDKFVLFNFTRRDLNECPSPIIQELVCFPRLRELQVLQITEFEAFQALVTMPNLTRLTVLEVTGPWAGLGHAISVRHLRELSVTGGPSAISNLFHLVRYQALKSAKIHLDSSEEVTVAPDELPAFLSLFYNAVSTSGLQSFKLELSSLRLPSEGDEPALRDLVAPILPICSLRSFNLDTVGNFSRVDDADVEVLASAWPRLQRLYIHRGLDAQSSISFNALHCLYRHCPDLKELSIARLRFPIIGVHSIPAPLDCSPPHPLQHLSVRNRETVAIATGRLGPELPDEHAEAMAMWLLDLFPRIGPRPYKRALGDSSSGSERREGPLSGLRFSGRWIKVSGYIHAICSASEGF
ncbi:hypothetical protein LXA43DRAFT_914184 [Ganoderma leucocontextum]|nr:hypothetical protein LXA43DRAFT_914184 [Ganoderma leucocontextum]